MYKEIRIRRVTARLLEIVCGDERLHVAAFDRGFPYITCRIRGKSIVEKIAHDSAKEVDAEIARFITSTLGLADFWVPQKEFDFQS